MLPDFNKPLKVWSSGGYWMYANLLAYNDNVALVHCTHPKRKIDYYRELDLKWYDSLEQPQFRNIKDTPEIPKVRQLVLRLTYHILNYLEK